MAVVAIETVIPSSPDIAPNLDLEIQPSPGTVIFPDFERLSREQSAKKEIRDRSDSTKAEFYISKTEGEIGIYPIGFKEPQAFAIEGSEEWQKYVKRREAVMARVNNALLGVPFN